MTQSSKSTPASAPAYSPAQIRRFRRFEELWNSRKLVFTVEGALREESADAPPSLMVSDAFTELFAVNPNAASYAFPFTAKNGVRISFHVSPSEEEINAELARVV